jgi:hypothetical protein
MLYNIYYMTSRAVYQNISPEVAGKPCSECYVTSGKIFSPRWQESPGVYVTSGKIFWYIALEVM